MVTRCRSLAVLAATVLVAASATAQTGPLPAGWTCIAANTSTACGTLNANGVIVAPPNGEPRYAFVSTNGGAAGVNLPGVGGNPAEPLNPGAPVNGALFRTAPFTAAAGDNLRFFFNYATTDGAGYADYAWARLLTPSLTQAALLFTARTVVSGSVVPGQGMPTPAATLTPGTVPIQAVASGNPDVMAGPAWLPLGQWSGQCFDVGCGYTGWVRSNFSLAAAGQYILEVGVTNWDDEQYDSGLAIAGLALNEVPVGTPPQIIPEPGTVILVASGLLGMAVVARRRRR